LGHTIPGNSTKGLKRSKGRSVGRKRRKQFFKKELKRKTQIVFRGIDKIEKTPWGEIVN